MSVDLPVGKGANSRGGDEFGNHRVLNAKSTRQMANQRYEELITRAASRPLDDCAQGCKFVDGWGLGNALSHWAVRSFVAPDDCAEDAAATIIRPPYDIS